MHKIIYVCTPGIVVKTNEGDSMSGAIRKVANDNDNSNNTSNGDPAETKRRRRRKKKTLKRALKGTVGVGLAAASAVLIARCDDIGEWLESVAPNVLPHTGAGADIVLRAIAEAKSCIQEGANVCLDAEGRVTALCEAYPHTHNTRERVVSLCLRCFRFCLLAFMLLDMIRML